MGNFSPEQLAVESRVIDSLGDTVHLDLVADIEDADSAQDFQGAVVSSAQKRDLVDISLEQLLTYHVHLAPLTELPGLHLRVSTHLGAPDGVSPPRTRATARACWPHPLSCSSVFGSQARHLDLDICPVQERPVDATQVAPCLLRGADARFVPRLIARFHATQ